MTGVNAPPFTILCFGYHPWSNVWKRNQSMMAALAERPAIERIVFFNPEVAAADAGQLVHDLRTLRRHSWRGVVPSHPHPKIEVLTPVHWLPLRRHWARMAELDRELVRSRLLAAAGDRPFILFVNGVREETVMTSDLIAEEAMLRVFDWSDDFAQYPRDPAAKAHVESLTERCLDSADLVLAVNENLAARARARGRRVERVINATGLSPEPTAGPGAAEAARLAHDLQRPILGYSGFINEHRVDRELVLALARRHPDWTILFLGLVQLEFDRGFADVPNVVFHPLVPYAKLADYLAMFDVCLIPHLDNPHTAGNNPLKLYDYLTTGRPIVATRVAGTVEFADVVHLAADREAFIRAVEVAVRGREAGDLPARRRARAAENTWAARARQVEATILAAVRDRSGQQAAP
jgi:glycosyltransferase involved in cell wall biosynthesis